jgi:nucleotide-binding universal stress UspA family protein
MQGLYKKILIATDGSENNISAIKEGLRIAQACGSEIYAVYVIDDSVLNQASLSDGETPVYDQLKEEGKRAVERVKAMAGDVDVKTAVLEGKPAKEIVKFGADNGADLLVVGTTGKSHIESLLLGSVADALVRTAQCPVLVIKAKAV